MKIGQLIDKVAAEIVRFSQSEYQNLPDMAEQAAQELIDQVAQCVREDERMQLLMKIDKGAKYWNRVVCSENNPMIEYNRVKHLLTNQPTYDN